MGVGGGGGWDADTLILSCAYLAQVFSANQLPLFHLPQGVPNLAEKVHLPFMTLSGGSFWKEGEDFADRSGEPSVQAYNRADSKQTHKSEQRPYEVLSYLLTMVPLIFMAAAGEAKQTIHAVVGSWHSS